MTIRPMMIVRALRAGVVVAYAKLRGYRVLTTPEEQEKRLDSCYGCPWLRIDEHDNDQCGKCWCFISGKTALTTEKCPVGKWARIWDKTHTT